MIYRNDTLFGIQLLIDAEGQKHMPLSTIILLIPCLNLGKITLYMMRILQFSRANSHLHLRLQLTPFRQEIESYGAFKSNPRKQKAGQISESTQYLNTNNIQTF